MFTIYLENVLKIFLYSLIFKNFSNKIKYLKKRLKVLNKIQYKKKKSKKKKKKKKSWIITIKTLLYL